MRTDYVYQGLSQLRKEIPTKPAPKEAPKPDEASEDDSSEEAEPAPPKPEKKAH